MTKIKYGIESKTKWMKNHRGGGIRRVGQDHQWQIRHLWESSQERYHSIYCLASNTFKREWTFNVIVLVIVSFSLYNYYVFDLVSFIKFIILNIVTEVIIPSYLTRKVTA